MTDVRTPDPAKASPGGPPDRELLRNKLYEIFDENNELTNEIMALIAKDRTAHAEEQDWQKVLEYYLGDYVWEHTAAECRKEAFRRSQEESKEWSIERTALLQRVRDSLPEKNLTWEIDFPNRSKSVEAHRRGLAMGHNQAIDSVLAVLDNITEDKK